MATQIQEFRFDEQVVEFDLSTSNIMVNATEMAKIFEKKVEAFMRNESTQAFISEALKSENSRFLGIEKEEDLYVSRQRSGTWMHRILALKFAAWLDPRFELWVYSTIDKLLFGGMRDRLRRKAQVDTKLVQLKTKLFTNNPELIEQIKRLEIESKNLANENARVSKEQYSLFKSEFMTDEE